MRDVFEEADLGSVRIPEFLEVGVELENFDFTARRALWYTYCYVGFF